MNLDFLPNERCCEVGCSKKVLLRDRCGPHFHRYQLRQLNQVIEEIERAREAIQICALLLANGTILTTR